MAQTPHVAILRTTYYLVAMKQKGDSLSGYETSAFCSSRDPQLLLKVGHLLDAQGLEILVYSRAPVGSGQERSTWEEFKKEHQDGSQAAP